MALKLRKRAVLAETSNEKVLSVGLKNKIQNKIKAHLKEKMQHVRSSQILETCGEV